MNELSVYSLNSLRSIAFFTSASLACGTVIIINGSAVRKTEKCEGCHHALVSIFAALGPKVAPWPLSVQRLLRRIS